MTPDGNAFLSAGVNHVDYREDYTDEFVAFVCTNLREWGFNTIGWSQESLSSEFVKGCVPHSRGWDMDQYRHASMPFMHLLRFSDIEWYVHGQFPDVFSRQFEEKCDRVARSFCPLVARNPMLIGYFYADTPNWPRWAYETEHDLRKESDRRDFRRIACRYYEVIHNTIRRYDENHLLFGDRYKGDSVILVDEERCNGLPDCVLEAMRNTVDVLSIEYFDRFEAMKDNLNRWHQLTKKPILLADSAFMAPTEALHISTRAKVYVVDQAARGHAYQNFAREAYAQPWLVGWHWCAFGRSPGRKSGLLDGNERPYSDCVDAMGVFNNKELYRVAGAQG